MATNAASPPRATSLTAFRSYLSDPGSLSVGLRITWVKRLLLPSEPLTFSADHRKICAGLFPIFRSEAALTASGSFHDLFMPQKALVPSLFSNSRAFEPNQQQQGLHRTHLDLHGA